MWRIDWRRLRGRATGLIPVLAAARTAALVSMAVAVGGTLAACSTAPTDPAGDYVRKLQAERAAKDTVFASAANSPIPADKRGVFLPLRYFAPDPAYAVPASLVPAPVRTPVKAPTSTGKIRDMEVVGTLEFTLNGRALSLAALVEADTPADRLFIPFSDLTSGAETYSAGRYLEVERSRSGIYTVDFNRAFNPYCYYNHDYDCPYPPAENRLPVPIHAGERMAQSNVPGARR